MATFSEGTQYNITAVSFGVESANVTQPVRVRLYTTANFPSGYPNALTQIGNVVVTVSGAQNGTVVTAPLTATVPAGISQLVMEVNTPDGRSSGRMFFIGSNSEPESGPSYISAAGCDVGTPTTTAALGAPGMHVVFNVIGTCSVPTPTPRPAALWNLSTRLRVGTDDQVMTAGFIVQGPVSKRVLIRAVGPSLTGVGVPGALSNPYLELHDASSIIGTNDDWLATEMGGVITSDQVAEIEASGLAPNDPMESAIVAQLAPGSYTAILKGVSNGTGVGIVEVYDLETNNGAQLGNISTRGYVQTGDNMMIGGFIVLSQATKVMIRAIGPSLTQVGVPNVLGNPQLELHDSIGLLARNDDWQTTQIEGIITGDQVAEIQDTQLAPSHSAESAMIATLPPGSYTTMVRGVNDTDGNAVVEVYALP